jgi:hypothetical protein
MKRSIFKIATYTILITIVLLCINLSAEDKYKKYVRTETHENFLKLSLQNKKVALTVYGGDTSRTFIFSENDVLRTDGEIKIKKTTILNKDGFILNDKTYPIDLIDKLDIKTDKNGPIIDYLKKEKPLSGYERNRRKNRIAALENIDIKMGEFIRGSVASFWGDINIDGEVNEDVVALFGDILIGDSAVVRGDIVAIHGNVEVSKKATIYGEIYISSTKKKFNFDRWRWRRGDRDISAVGMFYYNRVDGAAPYLGAKFTDSDSLLPEVKAYGGYAFASKRWRFFVGVEKSFLLNHPLTIGASFYRKLASPDDWLISESKNTAFALIATEDYKDYYEAQGGYFFARFTPYTFINGEMGVRAEKLKWLEAHRNLWSLCGGKKLFPLNYSGVPEAERMGLVDTLDGRKLTSLIGRVKVDTRGEYEDAFESSFWKGFLEMELAPNSWNDDFNYVRYLSRVTRYQAINKNTGFLLSATLGGSGNDLPYFKKFFIGGLGTLYGYYFKEYVGTEFWLGDIEYRIQLLHSGVTGWLYYNVGQIADSQMKLSDAEVKNSLGFGLSFNDELRVSLARRLDHSDVAWRIHVDLGMSF